MIKDVIKLFESSQINLTEYECSKLLEYQAVFQAENAKYNLMSRKAEHNFIADHLIDSLQFKLINLSSQGIGFPYSIIDLGSGGGLPGIPIAITHAECNITLTESVKKKTDFLSIVLSKLELTNCRVINGRIEEIAQDNMFRESFDVVTSRALASMPVLLEYALPLLKIGGICVFYKTEGDLSEINKLEPVLSLLGGTISSIEEYRLKLKDSKRSLIIVKKVDKTPKRFPRNFVAINKRPLS